MNTIASSDRFKPLRIGENLVVNYNVEYDPSNNNNAAAYRLVYECLYGLIPKGRKIYFREKDQNNLRLDN